jgi:hypothetical protein
MRRAGRPLLFFSPRFGHILNAIEHVENLEGIGAGEETYGKYEDDSPEADTSAPDRAKSPAVFNIGTFSLTFPSHGVTHSLSADDADRLLV